MKNGFILQAKKIMIITWQNRSIDCKAVAHAEHQFVDFEEVRKSSMNDLAQRRTCSLGMASINWPERNYRTPGQLFRKIGIRR